MKAESRPLSVAHILAPAPFGGLETVVVTLSRAQAELGARVTVVLVVTPEDPSSAGHPVARALEGSGVHVETWVIPARGYVHERRRVADLLDRRSVDVLHTHGYRPDLTDAGVARKRGVGTTSTVHGRIGGSWKGRLYEWAQTKALRRFDAVIAVSEKLFGELRGEGIPEEALHLVPNAWSAPAPPMDGPRARAVLGIPAEAPAVGWVGRVSGEKGPDVFIEAAAHVSVPGTVFSVIGDGPMREACEDRARQAGISHRVRFHGSVPEAGRLLAAHDVFALTSWTEGTPMALLEAIHAGVPVVATRVGGVPNVVGEDEAVLCDPGDVAAVARGIEHILNEPDAASRRADAARRRLERDFAVEPWARRHLDIYQSIADR